MTREAISLGQACLPSSNPTASFWHSQPSRLLIGHRTTGHLPTKADVVIIGSGIAGAFAAHYIAEDDEGKDLKVVMLEAREACWGATGRNGGHCQPKLYNNPPHIARFELDNLQNLRTLVNVNDIDCEWQDVDSCHAYTSHTLFEKEVAAVNVLRSLDSELGKMLTVVTPEPIGSSMSDLRLGEEVVGAIVQKSSASLWPYKLITWVLERLLSANKIEEGSESGSFNLQTSTPATCLQHLEDGGWIVHTPRGMLSTRNVILATNGYTSYLLPRFMSLIVPVRGQMSSLKPPSVICPDDGKPLAGRNSYGFYGRGTGTGPSFNQDDYLIQRPFSKTQKMSVGGELMLGGARQHAAGFGIGVSSDSDIELEPAKYLRQELNKVLDLRNNRKELEASYEWSGIMGFSKDGRPWVGHVPEELGGAAGLWICAGFTGHGMSNASLCAKAVVDMIIGKLGNSTYIPPEYEIFTERAGMTAGSLEALLPGTVLNEIYQ